VSTWFLLLAFAVVWFLPCVFTHENVVVVFWRRCPTSGAREEAGARRRHHRVLRGRGKKTPLRRGGEHG
jgi:hypothetical protein